MSARVVVVGAGVAGLACAQRIHTRSPDLAVTVVEGSPRTGGKVLTSDLAGRPVDEAADGFLARVPAAVELCRELGLEDSLTQPVAGRASVWHNGALRPYPEGLVLGVPTDLDALAASGVVSPAGVARAAQDLTAPADGPPEGTDESVGALVRRRLGDEVFDVLVGPLLSGINAGDADRLSLAAGAPQLAAGAGGSLIEGLRRARAARPPVPGAPVFRGLTGGIQQLTDALTAALPDVQVGRPVTAVEPTGPAWTVRTAGGGHLDADAVVLALPTFAAAPLVRPFAPDLAGGLDGLEWSSVAVVTFAVPADALDVDPGASGFLVAQGEDLLMTACSFGSSKWPHWRGDDGLVILRVSAGRHPDRRALDLTDAEVVARLTADLRTTVGLRGEPAAVRVSRWERSLPQYRPGHLDRARRWKEQATYHPGLFLTGASYLGLGVPACVVDGQVTAEVVAAHLTARSGARA